MSVRKLVVRLGAGAALGLLVAVADTVAYGEPQDWVADPVAAIRGFARVVGSYGAMVMAGAIVLSWRWLRVLVVGGFTVALGVARYYHEHPDTQVGPFLLVVGLSLLGAVVAVRAAGAVLGTSTPRLRVITAVLVTGAILSCGALLALRAQFDSASASVPTPSAAQGSTERAFPAPAPRHEANVLILTFDTLRADRLGVYGYDRIRTPNIDRMAAEGAVFLRAIAQVPVTQPSHASLFTGVYPTRHGVRMGGHLDPGRPTLAEILRARGYATGAIIAAVPLAPGQGFERGFDSYDFVPPRNEYPFFGSRKTLLAKVLMRTQVVPDRWAYRRAEEQTDRARAWLDGHAGRPFFLWVHYFDAHDPYAPPRRWLRRAAHPRMSPWGFLARGYLYDSEVAYLDEQVGPLLDHLRSLGVLDDTIVVGISDHGEGLGEHDYVGHSYRLYNEQLRVAFSLRYPVRVPAGRRVEAQVRTIDVMPTILDLLDQPPPEDIQGRSLLPLISHQGDGADRVAFSETLVDAENRQVAVSDGRYKLIVWLSSARELLFDLASDSLELHNVIGNHPEVAQRLRREVQRYLAEAPLPGRDEAAVDVETRRQLRALGYVN
jgi:arylsulfatase A-like enzyme